MTASIVIDLVSTYVGLAGCLPHLLGFLAVTFVSSSWWADHRIERHADATSQAVAASNAAARLERWREASQTQRDLLRQLADVEAGLRAARQEMERMPHARGFTARQARGFTRDTATSPVDAYGSAACTHSNEWSGTRYARVILPRMVQADARMAAK